jgi:hypothetical protein
MGVRTWLKRVFLPFEFEDHPLYSEKPPEKLETDCDPDLEAIEELFGSHMADWIRGKPKEPTE